MLDLISGIQASESPQAWRMTEKAGPDRVKALEHNVPSLLQHASAQNTRNLVLKDLRRFLKQKLNLEVK